MPSSIPRPEVVKRIRPDTKSTSPKPPDPSPSQPQQQLNTEVPLPVFTKSEPPPSQSSSDINNPAVNQHEGSTVAGDATRSQREQQDIHPTSLQAYHSRPEEKRSEGGLTMPP